MNAEEEEEKEGDGTMEVRGHDGGGHVATVARPPLHHQGHFYRARLPSAIERMLLRDTTRYRTPNMGAILVLRRYPTSYI